MDRLKLVWQQFRRGEQWILATCALLLVVFGACALAKRRSTPPLPPLFADAPTVKAAAGAVAPPAGGTIMVQVAGEVSKPGVLELPANARVVDAVRKAGGATKTGDLDALNLAARLEDGQKIVVAQRAAQAEKMAAAPSTPDTSDAPAAPSSGAVAKLSGPINVNTAGAAQLDLLPGIGPKTAALIIAYRQEHGAFHSLQELDNVKGLGAKKLEKMAPYVVF